MIVYVENLKESTKKLLELRNSNKVADYKVNIQKSTTLLYMNNEQVILKLKTILFPLAS